MTAYDPAPDFVIAVPRPDDWINANNRRRMHWTVDRRLTATWRTRAAWAARQAKLPALGPSLVIAELRMHARRRSRVDPANYGLTAKPCVDGLVDAGIWPDDSSDWVTGPDMRLGDVAKPDGEALVLLIWGKPCCASACTRHGKAVAP